MPGDYRDYDPNDPNMGSQADPGRVQASSNEQVASLNRTIAADPRVRAWVNRQGGVELDDNERQAFQSYLQTLGYSIPENLEVTQDGRVLPINHDARNLVLTAIMAAPLFLPSGGGAAAAGSASVPGYGGVAAPTLGVSGTQAVTAAGTIAPAATSVAAPTATNSVLSRVGSSKFLNGAADILGGAAKSASQNNAIRDANAVNLYNSQESNQLARDRFALDAPGTRMGQSAKASILSRVKPTTINWGGPGSGVRGQVPTTTGGFRDGLQNMDPAVSQLAQEIMQQNLTNQRANKDGVTVTPPRIGRSSVGDKLLGAGAFGTSILGLLRR